MWWERLGFGVEGGDGFEDATVTAMVWWTGTAAATGIANLYPTVQRSPRSGCSTLDMTPTAPGRRLESRPTTVVRCVTAQLTHGQRVAR